MKIFLKEININFIRTIELEKTKFPKLKNNSSLTKFFYYVIIFHFCICEAY